MFSGLRSRLSYANVVATLALFLALTGGTAVALTGTNTVFSDDITNGQVKRPDVANNAVNGGKVASNSLTGSDVAALGGGDVNDNSLTGNDVNESTFGQVPSAQSAGSSGNANTLDGQDSTAFLSANGKAADADKLDGKDLTQVEPLVASVNSLGTVVGSPDVVGTASVKLRTGIYVVDFGGRDVSDCHRVASLGTPTGNTNNSAVFNGAAGEISTFAEIDISAANRRKIGVATRDSAGTLADKDFQLAVFC